MHVNFPDRPNVQIDTLHVSRTNAGVLEGHRTAKQLQKYLEDQAHKTWGARDGVRYYGLENPGYQSVLCWLSHDTPIHDPDEHGSHAFLVFTCDPPSLDAPLTTVVQELIDRAELRWEDVAQDFSY